jgi:hypothetical protein
MREQGSEYKDKVGREFFERARDRGWHECVWDKDNPGDEVQTWFGGGNHIRQDDHVFCDQTLGRQVGQPWVAKEAATGLGLSHHAPLVLDFDIEPIAMTSLRRAVKTDDDATAAQAATDDAMETDHSPNPTASGP